MAPELDRRGNVTVSPTGSTGFTAHVAHATSNMQAFATAADRAGIVYAPGDVTYLIDTKKFQFWDGTAWQDLGAGGGAAVPLLACFAGFNIDYGMNWNDVQSGVEVPFGQTNPTPLTVTTMPIALLAGHGVRCFQGAQIPVPNGVLRSQFPNLMASNAAGTQVWGGSGGQVPLGQGQTIVTWSASSWLVTGTDLQLSADNQSLVTTAGGIFTFSFTGIFTWQAT